MERIEKLILIWSARNPVKARILIGLLFVLLVLTGLVIGKILQVSGIIPGKSVTLSAIAIMLAGLLIYPSKALLWKERMFMEKVYRRQKIAHWLLMFGFLVFLITMPAQFKNFKQVKLFGLNKSFAVEYNQAGHWQDVRQVNEAGENTQLAGRLYPSDVKDGIIGRILLVILLFVIAVGLIFVISAAACINSCGGTQAVVTAIMIIAGILEVYVVIMIIRQLVKIFKFYTSRSSMDSLSN